MTKHPAHESLRTVIEALEHASLQPALGGSGLLHAHGLVDEVEDWDITIDAEVHAVTAALDDASLDWTNVDDYEGFATAGRLRVPVDDATVHVAVQFAIISENEAVHIPSLIGGTWNDIPLGSIEAWLVAYRLMGRESKHDAILTYLEQHGANSVCVQRLLAEPLPESVRQELDSLR